MTSKQTNTLREEIGKVFDDIGELESYEVYKKIEHLVALFQKVVDKAVGEDENIIFLSYVSTSNARAKNKLRAQIRAFFKDIVEGKIEI